MPYDSAPRNCFFQRRQGMTLERLFLLIPHVAEAPEPLWAPRAPRPKESLMFTLSNPAWKSNHPVAAAAGLIHTPSDQAAASPTSHRANEAFSPIPLEVEDAAVGSPHCHGFIWCITQLPSDSWQTTRPTGSEFRSDCRHCFCDAVGHEQGMEARSAAPEMRYESPRVCHFSRLLSGAKEQSLNSAVGFSSPFSNRCVMRPFSVFGTSSRVTACT